MDGITFEQMSSIMGSGFTSIEQSNKRVSDTLEKIQITLGKKFDKIGEFFAVYQTEEQKKAKRDKEPKEVKFTKDTKQLIGKLDQSKTNEAILKEFRGLRQKDKGFMSSILGPIGLLLGGVATLAFGLTKFPAFKKMFEEFKQGKILSSVTSLLQKFAGKDKSLKEMIRSIPFVGRLIDAYEGFTSIFQGDFTKGIKQLAFAIPGAEFIADFFGTSKARLLAGDLTGDKSRQFNMFGKQFTFEDIFKKITEFPAPFFNQIGDFFNKISDLFVDLYSLVTMGSGARYHDIVNVLDNIGDYFPAVRGVTNFMKMLTGKAFLFTENKMKNFSFRAPEYGLAEINIGDVFNEIVKSISEKINAALKTVFNIFEAIMNVFSDDPSKIFKGLAVLEKYAPGLAQGLRVVRSLIDQFKDAPLGGNIFDKFKFFNNLDLSGKQYSPERVYDLNPEGLPNLAVERREKDEKELQERQAYLDKVKSPEMRKFTTGLTTAALAGTAAAGASYAGSQLTGNITGANERAVAWGLLGGGAGFGIGAALAKLTQPSDEEIKALEDEVYKLKEKMGIERQKVFKDAENESFKYSPYDRLKTQETTAPKPASKEEKPSLVVKDEVEKSVKTTAINSEKGISLQEQMVVLLTAMVNLPGLAKPGVISVMNQSANMNFGGTNSSNLNTRSRFAGSV